MGETKTYTLEDLEKMPKADAELILAKAVKSRALPLSNAQTAR